MFQSSLLGVCTGEDDKVSEPPTPSFVPQATVPGAKTTSWRAHPSWVFDNHHLSLQSAPSAAAAGSSPGLLGNSSINSNMIGRTQRVMPRPARPANQVDRDKPPYSVDLLEYLCSTVESLGITVEDIHRHCNSERDGRSSLSGVAAAPGRASQRTTLGLHNIHAQQHSLLGHQASGVDLSTSKHTASFSSQLASGSAAGSANSRVGSAGGMAASKPSSSAVVSDGSDAFGGRSSTQRVVDKQWPASIQIRNGLEENGVEVNKDKVRSMMGKALTTQGKTSFHSNAFFKVANHYEIGFCSKLLMMKDPNSKFVRIVDMLSCLALVNDCVVTPFTLAWNMESTPALQSIAMFSAVYWSLWIVLKFRIGFYEDGELRMGQWEIIKRYMRTTFFLDIILTTLDWSVIFLPTSQTGPNVRMIKLIRTAKIFRLARVWEVVENLVDNYAPEGTSSKLIIRLGQVMISTTIFSHILSCAWFSFGKDGHSDTGPRWFEIFLARSVEQLEPYYAVGWEVDGGFKVPIIYQYITCFHWTLAQLTLGSVDIYPVNTIERTFNVAILFAGIIFNATIVSLISSQAVEFIANRREQILKIQTLKKFLEQHKVDTKLAVRVQRQVLDRIRSANALIAEDDVQALQMMSMTLKSQLLFETRVPHVLGHALFRVWWETEEHALRDLCEQGVEYDIYKAYDCVFLPGMQAEGMVVLTEGTLRYTQDPHTSREAELVEFTLNRGVSLCEAGLWSSWTHVGKCECLRSSSLLGVTARGLIGLLPSYPLIGHITRQYGRAFHMRITCARPPFSRWPNDVEVPHTNPSDLLEQDIGLELLRREREKDCSPIKAMPDDDYLQLLGEVQKEKCAIEANMDGTLDRIVALVAVRVEREADTRILAEVGKYDIGKKVVTASCALPGTKRPRGELPHQTYDRLLKTDLKFIASGLLTVQSETQVEVKESQHFGLLTKYLRTVQHTRLNPDFEWPDMPYLLQALPLTPSCSPRVPDRSKRIDRKGTRRLSLTSLDAPKEPDEKIEDLSEEPVFLCEVDGKLRLYCWLYEHTFNFLRSNNGKPLLEKWVQSMDIAGSFFPLPSPEVALPSPDCSQVVQAIAGSQPLGTLRKAISGDFPCAPSADRQTRVNSKDSTRSRSEAGVEEEHVQTSELPRMTMHAPLSLLPPQRGERRELFL